MDIIKISWHSTKVIETAKMVIAEDDRVYRNQVLCFAQDYHPSPMVHVSGLGLAKARVFGMCFPFYSFMVRWLDRQRNIDSLAQRLLDLALGPLMQPTSLPQIDVAHLERIGETFLQQQLSAIRQEATSGPSVPPPLGNRVTDGFAQLVETCHQNIVESVGEQNYTDEVRMRLHKGFVGSVLGRMRVLHELQQSMR
jgi:hypothetical protein